MDMKMKYKSLPPLVEGKIHGYLRLVIDEVIWLKKYLGEISVFVSWWGETDKAQFRPADITRNVIRSQQETTTVYAIRTNLNLFEEYIKNCESIELVIISEETDAVIGKSQITDLLEIFKSGSCFRYVSIINNSGNKIGELHISMKLEHVTKSSSTLLKTSKHDKQVTAKLPFVSDIKNQTDVTHDRYTTCRKLKSEDNEIYKSVLKSRRTEFQEPVKRFNNEVTDNLVAQVVARAQRLRGALLKETCNEDVLTFNDNSLSNSLQSHISTEEQAKLCEYILGEDMTSSDESKALCTFRSTSLNPNLIDDTFSNLKTCKYDNKISTSNTQANSSIDEILEKKQCTSTKGL